MTEAWVGRISGAARRNMGKVLVAGATGLVGEAAITAFAAAGREIIAVSRRPPEQPLEGSVRHLAVDLRDETACRAGFSALDDVSHLVYAALYEKPGLIAGWLERDQMDVNRAMIANLMEPLAAASRLEHVTLLQGTKAYGPHAGPRVLLPAREREPRDPHENFYRLQEDYLRETAATAGFAWTIFRPQIIYGAAWGVAMNPLIPIAAYAAVRRELGLPFSFTGGATYVTELVGPRILGSALAWAASSEAARNETFNITNGDICAWRVLWPALARTFGMQQGPDETMKIADYLLEHEAVWDAVVARHGLRPIKLLDLLGESHHYVDRLLRPGSDTIALPNLVSTIKLRQAGFGDCYDTADGLRHWIGVLAERRLVPPLPTA